MFPLQLQISLKTSIIHNKLQFNLRKEDLNNKTKELAGDEGKLRKVKKGETEDMVKVKQKQKQEEKIA